jgi:hypothetical protein
MGLIEFFKVFRIVVLILITGKRYSAKVNKKTDDYLVVY